MPRGGKKKKGRNRNNTKRRDLRPTNNDGQPTKNSVKGSTAKAPFNHNGATDGITPNFDAFQQSGKALPNSYRTVYSRYKAATKRVFEYMQANSPEKNHIPREQIFVSSLVTTADWMVESRIPVDPDILKDLKFAIRARSKAAWLVYGGGDSGHKYLLDVLIYCWKNLDSLPRAEKDIIREGKEELDTNGEGPSSNRFEALLEVTGEDEGDDDDMDEEIFPSDDVPRPTLHAEAVPLQDLLDSDERNDAIMFLLALDDLMRCVVEKYRAVSRYVDYIVQEGMCGSVIVPSLMGAAIATNMAIHQVRRLEIEFELHNPHISTPYRLLSTIILPERVKQVIQITREHGQKVCSVRDANLFLGDCLECSFRSPADPENRGSVIVSDFCSRFGVDGKGSEDIDKILFELQWLVKGEVPLRSELAIMEKTNITSHGWIAMSYIGGDRAIHHTIRLLQWFGSSANKIEKGRLLKLGAGFFGSSPWQPGRSQKIHTDLDELLMVEILPSLFYLCRDGELNSDTRLPQQNEIAPFWSCLRRFARSPEKPVRWSTVFAVHAMLTSILETDKITAAIAVVCEKTFNSYFEQLDMACEYKKGVDGVFDSTHFQSHLRVVQYLKELGHPFYEPRARWNPLCAGTNFLYLTYFGNITVGTALIDDRSQLKIVLHLYHALIVNDILKSGDIPLLDWLLDGFENSGTFWGGSLPRKGKFAEQFWLGLRVSFRIPEEIVAAVSRLDDKQISNKDHLAMIEWLCHNEASVMRRLDPAEFSTSFRRICNRDYHDVVDKYHSKKMKQEGSGQDGYAFAVQLNDTSQAFVKEHGLFAFNLPALGVHLDEFVCGMSRFFKWDQLFKGTSLHDQNPRLQHPERIAEEYMFAHYVLGKLDQVMDPSELGRIKDFVTLFMYPFFEKLENDTNRFIWFRVGSTHPEWDSTEE
mmetsp:Transcript_14117/g.34211  ORF Transcript_14117/g.34211 Transcript_14117/m.34211 type:complete len:927 (-) Transcript_14117:25-2805(-)